jgi:hypothetical protein
MSSSSGGRADKLGNRYEGLWVAFDLLRLLAEEVAGVQLEAVGDEEACDGSPRNPAADQTNRSGEHPALACPFIGR